MAHEFMTGGGADVDMVHGRPTKTVDKQQIKAQKKYQDTVQGALAIAAELQGGNPIVRAVLKRYRARLMQLAAEDAECRTLEGILADLRFKLEVAPLLAEDRLRQVLGPQLMSFLEEPEEEEQVAPQGIPTSE